MSISPSLSSFTSYFLSLASRTVCWPPLDTERTSLPSNCLDLKKKIFQ